MTKLNSISMIILIVISLLSLTKTATLQIISPKSLKHIFPNGLTIHVSPLGFRPLSGQLDGRAILASPLGACSQIQNVHSENEDIFILSDDSQCLQSVKAKNIATSGGYAGIIKQNINNTLHDKQVNLVHIPIIEVKPTQFDELFAFMNNNTNQNVLLSLDFTDNSQTHPINFEVWFSPTQNTTYQFLFDIQTFLAEQKDQISFRPHYVLQSQKETRNYIGCISNGRYCPTQIQFEGKHQGKNIVDEILRQLIIWKMSSQLWWKYILQFYKNCLQEGQDIFLNTSRLDSCSQNSMIMAGVDQPSYLREYNNSFNGPNKQVADNTYLLQERQAYTREQIKSHPIGLINKKQVQLDVTHVQERMCKMQGKNQSTTCKSKHGLSTFHISVIVFVLGLLFVAIAIMYKMYMRFRMKTQIRGEVDKTLEQYYRYIQTFEGQNGQVVDDYKKKSSKIKSIPLTEELQQRHEAQQKVAEVEMGAIQK